MKLATWNINSIRVRTERLVAWLAREAPDVLCLQETKVEDSGFPLDALRAAGYEVAIYGQRSYNGVAIASRAPIADVTRGFGDVVPDDEARVIAATISGVRVVCVYVPNGQDLASDKYPYKLAWFGRLRAFLARTATPATPLAVCGDMNVTTDDLDVWSPEAWAGKIHCSAPERDALANLLAFGLADVFRAKTPEGQRLLVVGLPRGLVLQGPGPAHRLHLRDRAARRALHRVRDRQDRAQRPGCIRPRAGDRDVFS